MHTKQVRSNKQHQHPSYSLRGQYQCLVTFYFVHSHRASWAKQATSASITLVANILEISTYALFCTYTRSKLDQTRNVNIHHIHCKYPENIYLQPILCIR